MNKQNNTYKIPYNPNLSPEEMREVIKNWQDNSKVTLNILPIDRYTFLCPFRKTSNENFLPCYQTQCMAFRKADGHFWCANLSNANSIGIHPIELLKEDE